MRLPIFLPVISALLLVTALAGNARAQSCGGCTGPGVTSSPSGNAQTGPGRFRLRLWEEYEVKDRSYRGRHRVANDFAEDLYVNRLGATLRCGLDDAWAVEATVTRLHFAYNLKPPGAAARTRRAFDGPGDTSLFVGRTFDLRSPRPAAGAESLFDEDRLSIPDEPLPRTRLRLSIWMGVSAPTGDPERPDPRIVTRDVSVSNLQTGTGTWDPQMRVRLDADPGSHSELAWFAELATRVPVTENRYDYRTGAVAAVSAGVSGGLADRLTGGLAVTHQRVERDTYRGDRVAVGGGRWVYVTPSLRYAFTDRLAVDLSVRVAVWRDVETKLSDSRSAVQLGLELAF